MYSICSSQSESNASELLENLEEMFPLYYYLPSLLLITQLVDNEHKKCMGEHITYDSKELRDFLIFWRSMI